MNTSLILSELKRLANPRVLVIGDLILDEHIEGEVQRISREAPVPIVEEQRRHFKPGGAANTIYNLASLGARTTAIGVIGQDRSGTELLKLLVAAGVETIGVLPCEGLPTTTKTRISAQSRQSVMQQVLRLDCLPHQALGEQTLAALETQIAACVPSADVVIVSDYGQGVIVPRIIDFVREQVAQHQKIWIVDSQEDLRLFHGATLLTPNKPEAENNLGYRLEGEEAIRKAGHLLLQEIGAQALLITRGDEGMSLFQSNGDYHQVPALNRAAVFDVSGAGDTVVATLALAAGSGCSLVAAMELANLAASIVIRRYGCSTTTPAEMRDTLLAMQTKETAPHD